MSRRAKSFSVHFAFIAFAIFMLSIVDVLYFWTVWGRGEITVSILGYDVALGHLAIAIVYWTIIAPIVGLYLYYRKDRMGAAILAVAAFLLQYCLVEDVLFFLLQRQDLLPVQFTWLYIWNDLFHGPIAGETVLKISLIGVFLVFILFWRYRLHLSSKKR